MYEPVKIAPLSAHPELFPGIWEQSKLSRHFSWPNAFFQDTENISVGFTAALIFKDFVH
jgi:hypothetical protein